MTLGELPALLFEGVLRKWKRRAITYAICVVCALGIVVQTISITRILLERAFGPIGGRLFVIGILVLVIAAAISVLWRMEARAREVEAAVDQAVGAGKEERKVALIAQAINLGYSLSRSFGSGKPRPARDDDPPGPTSPPGNSPQPAA
jgi:hypothetical protein